MKRFTAVFATVALLTAPLVLEGANPKNAKKKTSRDLVYQEYSTQGAQGQGEPGSKIRVELSRGGAISWVTPTETFKSGDRIRLHLETNFKGFMGVVNDGTTGKRNVLLPQPGTSTEVVPSKDFQVPPGEKAWFTFDANPGTEKLVIYLSTSPIPELKPVEAAPAAAGGQVAPEQADKILNELNARSLRKGRDINIEVVDDAAFATAPVADLSGLCSIKLDLKHE